MTTSSLSESSQFLCSSRSVAMARYLILLFLASTIYAQDIIYEMEDDSCKLPNGRNGICKAGRSCPEAYENFPRVQPVICGFIGGHPNVCCPVKTGGVKDPDILVPLVDISPPVVDFECGDSIPNPVIVFNNPEFGSRPSAPIARSLSSPSRVPISSSSLPSTSGTSFTPSSSFPHNVGVPVFGGLPENPFPLGEPIKIASIGGVPARFVLVKYSAIVGSREPSGIIDWFCTGVLLNHRWVLTAAHCLQRDINLVRLGEHDYNDPNDGAHPVDYEVVEVISYPEFSHPQGYHDLALLKLSSQVFFGEFINPVCLPWGFASAKDITNQKISLTGWGATQFGGSSSSILQEVNVTVFSNSVCEQSYSELRSYDLIWPRGITEDIICAGDPEGGKDACQGDSGGPVVYLNDANQYVLAGVVSRGYGCGLKEFPGLYANIHHQPYLAWIKKVAFQ